MTSASSASAVTPANMAAAMPPIRASVVAAFRLFGGLNAGTPLAIASTPVSAVQPEANARSAKKSSARPAELLVRRLGRDRVPRRVSATSPASVKKYRMRPVTTMTTTPLMNR